LFSNSRRIIPGMMRLVVLCTLAVVLLFGVACGGGSGGGGILSSATSRPAATPSVPATTAPPTPTATQQANGPADLSLVYVDTRVPGTVPLFVAKYDGTAPKQVGTLPQGSRPLDQRGGTMAVANGKNLLLVDLKSGQNKSFTAESDIRFGSYLNDDVFLYTTAGACGGGPNGAPPASKIWRLDLKTMTPKQLDTGQGNTIAIVGMDATKGQVAIIKRGCDPGIGNFYIVDINTGAELETVDSFGCGFEAVAIDKKLSVISNCGLPLAKGSNEKFNQKVINFSGKPVTTDVQTAPGTALNSDPILIRPGTTTAVVGTQQVLTTPQAGGPRSTGLVLVDMANANVTALLPADGAEQWPIAWSPDGRYLLSVATQAQSNCSYTILDATSKAMTKVDPAVSMCGVAGGVAGWTKIRPELRGRRILS
jgi:hypothetical protein